MENEQVEYAAWIGLDWGGEKHSVCLQATDGNRVEHDPLEHTPEALSDWFLKLQRRFGGRKVAIALEQSKGAVINFLLGFDFVCIYPINPASLRSYGKALYLSGAKDDPTDAELLMQFLKMEIYLNLIFWT